MKITQGHFALSDEQRKFKNWLEESCPRISGYWDFNDRSCDVERLRAEPGLLSISERILVRLFAGIWFGENALGFDNIAAGRSLDDDHRQIIVD